MTLITSLRNKGNLMNNLVTLLTTYQCSFIFNYSWHKVKCQISGCIC